MKITRNNITDAEMKSLSETLQGAVINESATRVRASDESAALAISKNEFDAASRKRILVLSALCGNGHYRAGKALEQKFKRLAPNAIVQHQEMLELVPAWLRYVSSDLWIKWINTFPNLWGKVYHKMDKWEEKEAGIMQRLMNKVVGKKLFAMIGAFQPDLIIGTHVLHHMIFEGNEHRLPKGTRLALVVTDNGAHGCWDFPNADATYVFNEWARQGFLAHGRDPRKIFISGMPIEEKFYAPVDREKVIRDLGLDASKKTVTFIHGIKKWNWLEDAIDRAGKVYADTNFIFILRSGDKELYERLTAEKSFGPNVRLLREISNMHEILSATDLVVSKPGGSTTAEVLAKRVPIIVAGTVPGQEECNRDMLVQAGVGREVHCERDLFNTLDAILSHPEDLEAMKRRFAKISPPDPADTIVRSELQFLGIDGRE
ncbi:MAG: hypothetical protein NUW37_16230 [Planctomycetes bacterium]|nr:hypothetical protein [Planctomycetota bacterium]